jgi:hypothetical protein
VGQDDRVDSVSGRRERLGTRQVADDYRGFLRESARFPGISDERSHDVSLSDGLFDHQTSEAASGANDQYLHVTYLPTIF